MQQYFTKLFSRPDTNHSLSLMERAGVRGFFLLFLLLFPTILFAQVDNGYHINDWKYDARIHTNNVWDVTETMTVTFNEPRHGIYRYIPRLFVRHKDANGSDAKFTYYTAIDSIKVNGYQFDTYSNDDSQDNIVLRIGNEDITLEGQHTYIISYRIHYPDDRYEVSDQIFHSVLGADCNTGIDNFSFRLHFDKPLPQDIKSLLHIYSGEWGSTGNEMSVGSHVSRNEISGNVSDIEPYKAITLAAELPEGYWDGSKSENPLWFYIFLAIATIFFLLTMGYLIFHRRQRPVTVFEYNAPDGISSAEVGVIIDDSADLSDLNSLIVWFASKGYLKIRETEDKKDSDIELTKLRDLPDNAPKYQKDYWKVFFEKGDTILLSELGDRHNEISKALSSLSKHFHGKTSLTHTHWHTILTFIAFLGFGALTFCSSSSVMQIDDKDILFGIILWALPVLFVAVIRIAMSNKDMISSFRSRLIQYLIIIILGAAECLVFWLFFWNANDSFFSLPMALTLIGGGWLIALMAGRMMRDSEYRKEKMSLLLGFKDFIEKSELPMLKQQVDENPSYFFDVLPYAMVFGLTKKWQKKFKEIDIQAPDWYQLSSTTGTMNGLMASERINRAMTHSIKDSIAIASHDPNVGGSHGGSGGFSGGFSGGGGGGGGVGSW